MLVRNVMKRSVVVSKPNINLREASKVMAEMNIGSIVVAENDKPIGIVTSTDILKALSENKNVDEVQVKDIMSKPVITIDPSKKIEDAVDLMVKNKIKRLVVTENEKIVGIITASDIVAIEPKLLEELSKLMSFKLPGYSGG